MQKSRKSSYFKTLAPKDIQAPFLWNRGPRRKSSSREDFHCMAYKFDKICRPYTVILLPAHPASFAHKFLFQRVPGCNSIADLSLKIVFRTHKFAVGTH